MTQYSKSIAGKTIRELPEKAKESLIKFRQELLPARRELRMVRRKIRDKVDDLGRRIVFINLLSGPAAVLILAALIFVQKPQKKDRNAMLGSWRMTNPLK